MKKILLLVLVLVMMAVPITFAACSSVSQQDMLMSFLVCSEDGYELFTYDVYKPTVSDDKKDVVLGESLGTLTMRYEPMANGREKLTTELKIGEETAIYSTVIYKSIGLAPIYSYKKRSIASEGIYDSMEVNYGIRRKYLHAKHYDKDGKLLSDYRHERSGCFDNEQLYAIIRFSKIEESSYSISYTMISAQTASAETMKIGKSGTGEIKNGYGVGRKYSAFSITTDNPYAYSYGLGIVSGDVTLKQTKDGKYVSENKITEENASDSPKALYIKKVIHSIVEGAYEYVLRDIEVA